MTAQQPFPWRCHQCGQTKVIPTRMDYPAKVNYDGRLVSFVVRGVDVPTCQNCGAKVVTLAVDEAIDAALYDYLGLLTPDQIREEIERLGLTQKEVAEQLGIAEATLSRWVNRCVIQSRAMDNLLRVYFEFPQVRAALNSPGIELNVDTIPTAGATI
jgi:putative zinc finger/helix-turn-helix YgiT family protein